MSTTGLSEMVQYLESLQTRIDQATALALEALKDKMKKNYFNLAILGQQKRGKSTLVNAILGQPVLPMAVTPATSVITVVEYGTAPTVTIIHENGERRQVGVEDLADYITEEKNPCNERQVAVAHITFPSEFLSRGIRLVDTPGVGSIFEHNTQTAYGYLPHIDAALFVFSVDTPVAVEEIKYLRDVREQVPMIYFILNKADFYSDHEVKKLVEFTRAALQKELGQEVDIFPLSALMALEAQEKGDFKKLEESGFIALNEAVLKYFYEHKDRLMEIALRNKLGNLLVQVSTVLRLERQALDLSAEELQARIQSYTEFLNTVDREIRDVAVLLDGEVERILEELDEKFAKDKSALENSLTVMLENWYRENSGLKTRIFARAIEREALNNLSSLFEKWRQETDREVAEKFGEAQDRFLSRLDDIVARILGKACEVFGIDYTGERFKVEVTGRSEFYYKVGLDPLMLEISPRTFSGLLPRRILNRLIWQGMAKDIPQDVDRNYGRMRYDFLTRLRQPALELKSLLKEETEQTKQSVKASIEQALDTKAKGDEDTAQRKAEIERHLTRIEGYLAELRQAADRPPADAG